MAISGIALAAAVGAAAVAAAAVGAPAAAQTHPPDIEARLAAIIGAWTIPGQEKTYRETCIWFGKRAFVACEFNDLSDGSSGRSILGYSKARERQS